MTSKTNSANPLAKAAELADEENLIFLYSGNGGDCYLAWDLQEEFTDLASLEPKSEKLFGYLSYEIKNQLEDFARDSESFIKMPDMWFGEFKNIECHSRAGGNLIVSSEKIPACAGMTEAVRSNMSDEEYLSKAADVIERIKNGQIYQANLTRKFYGEFAKAPNPFEIFCELAKISPADYSAYIKIGDKHIISASPEKFLSIANGKATTSPIKGTMPLSRSAEDLANSEKDKAENLMIVDLMRNDLSRTCDNVKVDELFKIITHKKYHHMHSTISADVKSNPLDVTLGCFPPGSMTGAPKIEAMKTCSELEAINRGVYSGALGWISASECDLSVVIRTIIIEDNKFEFQAGGAIVADSDPQNELEEINTKLKAIREVLGV